MTLRRLQKRTCALAMLERIIGISTSKVKGTCRKKKCRTARKKTHITSFFSKAAPTLWKPYWHPRHLFQPPRPLYLVHQHHPPSLSAPQILLLSISTMTLQTPYLLKQSEWLHYQTFRNIMELQMRFWTGPREASPSSKALITTQQAHDWRDLGGPPPPVCQHLPVRTSCFRIIFDYTRYVSPACAKFIGQGIWAPIFLLTTSTDTLI